MHSIRALSPSALLWDRIGTASKVLSAGQAWARGYAKKPPPPCDPSAENPKCRRAYADIPPPVDPVCPVKCERRKKKPGILHRIKLRVVEGGTNFGTPFRRLDCKKHPEQQETVEEKEPEKSQELSVPKKVVPALPPARPGVQVSVLGADTAMGQYVSLLLKQCPCIKKLRLYESRDSGCSSRNLASVVQDLQHINTNCLVQAFSCACFELERCLQNTDIVLMLESGNITFDMPLEKRFSCQAPIVKRYADAIANECPRAFIIVCATPIDCMVPLVAQTLRETGWYDPRKLLGSLAAPEMRASTLAARALSLEPRDTRVPCVGGTEGQGLVPLFSKAVEYFDFTEHNAALLTNAVRTAQNAVTRKDDAGPKAADLSEAHALAGLVTKVAHALLCHDIPRVTGFVETDSCQLVSPANYLAIDCILNGKGICKRLDFPRHLSDYEIGLLELALDEVTKNVSRSFGWYFQNRQAEMEQGAMAMRTNFNIPRHYHHLDNCTVNLT